MVGDYIFCLYQIRAYLAYLVTPLLPAIDCLVDLGYFFPDFLSAQALPALICVFLFPHLIVALILFPGRCAHLM